MAPEPKAVSSWLFSAISHDNLDLVQELVSLYGLSYSPDFWGGYALLHNAVQVGHYAIAKFLLQKGAVVDKGTGNPDSPLNYAVKSGDLRLVQFILEEGGLVDVQKRKNEALHLAIQKRRENVVQLLLKIGADPNAVLGSRNCESLQLGRENDGTEASGHVKQNDVNDDEGNLRPFHLAVEADRLKIVEMLISYGADLNAQTNKGSTPLLLAAKQNLTTICKTLLKAGACVSLKDENNYSPLYFATKSKNLYLMNSILPYNPDFDDKVRELVLHMVTCKSKAWHEIVDKFVDHGLMPNGDDVHNASLLHAAVCTGYTKLVRCLLSRGASPEATLLHRAVRKGNKEIVELLVSSGCDVNTKDKLGYTPIFYAMKSPEVAEFLCISGTAVEYLPDLLHEAVRESSVEILKTLIRNNVDVNSRHLDGRTALHQAVSKTSEGEASLQRALNVADLLLRNGADVTLKTSTGFTALHLGIIYGNKCAVSLLVQFGADVNCPAEDGSTPLHLACVQGNVEIVDVLLKRGASLTLFQANGLMPLHIAALRGHSDVVEKLLDHNVDINVRGASNETALHCAVVANQRDVVAVLLENRCDVNLENSSGETAFNLASADADHLPDEVIFNVFGALLGRKASHHVVTILRDHVIKLSVAGFYVSEKNSSLLDQDSEVYVKCSEEISRMKCEKLAENYTLYDILMKQSRYPRHLADESLVNKLVLFDYSKYRLFKSWLKSTVEKGRKRILFLTQGRESLVTLLKTSNVLNVKKLPVPPLEMVEEIVSLFNEEDLKNLISCSEGIRKRLARI